MKIANRDAREYVQKQLPFKGNNLTGQLFCVNPTDPQSGNYGYAVFSYGVHSPLFVCIHINGEDLWFENEDEYSRTTTKHHTQCHPHVDIRYALSTSRMCRLIEGGYAAIAKDRVIEGVPSQPAPIGAPRNP
jgi:hypothetical protein